ncbi:hypothetical protein SIIN_6273_T [Serendipita indica DSM 11827]|nr:hypothetical protein SIIN_6273_T [Serendipita indica DSM 11827]
MATRSAQALKKLSLKPRYGPFIGGKFVTGAGNEQVYHSKQD